MQRSFIEYVLDGLPRPDLAPKNFYGRIDSDLWPSVEAIAATVELPDSRPQDTEAELYLAALARITCHWWNPFKYGPNGSYFGVPDIGKGRSYVGHNIAALAVGDDGRIIDFEMNHNEIFRSSAEHAEARLVRRLYQLANVHLTWDEMTDDSFDTTRIHLNRITVYTTLQPCAQCAGMMALAQVRSAVFLQADPGMYLADVLMRALSPDYLRAPMPLPASLFGIATYRRLNEGYTAYWKSGSVLWDGPEGPRGGQDITAYLCTSSAFQLISSLAERFEALADTPECKGMWDGSEELIVELREFVAYACSNGVQRGAPHRV